MYIQLLYIPLDLLYVLHEVDHLHHHWMLIRISERNLTA